MKKGCIILLFAIVWQGCMLERLSESKRQLCADQIRLSISDSMSLFFDAPTLYPIDIEKMLGQRPSSIERHDDTMVYGYEMTRKDDFAGVFDVPIEFEFIEMDGCLRLARATAYKKVDHILPESFLKSLFSKLCSARRKGRTIEIAFDDVPLDDLPDMHGIKRLLGEPHQVESDRYTFFYDLNASDSAVIEIIYDADKEQPRSMQVIFFNYIFSTDFDQKKAVGAFKDWGIALKLGFIIAISR